MTLATARHPLPANPAPERPGALAPSSAAGSRAARAALPLLLALSQGLLAPARLAAQAAPAGGTGAGPSDTAAAPSPTVVLSGIREATADELEAARDPSQQIDTLVSNLPLLPPEKATKRFDQPLGLTGITVEQFLALMAQKPFLDLNIVIAASGAGLKAPVDIYLTDLTLGEVFNLVLQLNSLKAIRFSQNTLIIVNANDQRSFGVKQQRLYRLTYTTPKAVVDFIRANTSISGLIDTKTLIQDEKQGTLLVIDAPDRIKVLDHVVSLLDAKPHKITARIPVSHLDKADVDAAINNLPAEIKDRLETNKLVFSENGRTIIAYDTPEDVALLRDLIRHIDIGKKQALIDCSIMEIAQTLARDIGLQLAQSQLSVTSLDKIWNLDRLRRDVGTTAVTGTNLSYLLQRQGGNTIANPKIRVVDKEQASINVGQVRNVRVQTAQFSTNQLNTSQQTTFNTQEVPIGVTLNVTPEIHNDGTVTLELDIQDEEIISIQDFGVDRTTRNSNTTLRTRDAETVILGGFINRAISYDSSPIPVLGRLPLLKNFFRRNQRSKLASELVILLTPYVLDYDPVSVKAEADVLKPGKSLKNLGFSDAATPPEVRSTTTRWIETKDERTKVIYDAQGQVIYQRSFPRDKAAPGPAEGSEAEPSATGAAAPTPPASTAATSGAGDPPKVDFTDLYQEPLSAPEGGAAPAPKPAASSPPPKPASGGGDEWSSMMDELDSLAAPGT